MIAPQIFHMHIAFVKYAKFCGDPPLYLPMIADRTEKKGANISWGDIYLCIIICDKYLQLY